MAEGYEPRPMDGYIGSIYFGDTHHANINEVENAYYIQIGRVVIIRLTFSVLTTITDSEAVLFSGLPKSTVYMRFRILPTGRSNNTTIPRLAIDTNGNILNQWTQNNDVHGITPGWYEGQGVYICA